MYFDGTDIAGPQSLLVGEIRPVVGNISHGDLVAHRVTETTTQASLHLRLDDIRVHRNAAIDGTGHLLDTHTVAGVA